MHPTHFRPRPEVRFRIIAGEAVVLRQDVGETLVLNEVGARVLQLLAAGTAASDLPERIVQEFAVSPDIALADTAAFVAELVRAGVLEAVAPSEETTPCHS